LTDQQVACRQDSAEANTKQQRPGQQNWQIPSKCHADTAAAHEQHPGR
jgi:hypothetical protein